MKLVAFKYGETELTENTVFLDGKADKMIPIDLLFFLIETEGKKILIDVGCDEMPGFNLYTHKKPIEVLRMYGLEPSDITDVYLTHAHRDHIGAIKYFENALIHCNINELSKVQKKTPGWFKIETFGAEQTICEKVKIKHIGGHTAGSCIVLVETDETTLVLCGDECYHISNLTEKKPTASTVDILKSTDFVNEYSKSVYTPILFHETTLVYDIGYKVLL